MACIKEELEGAFKCRFDEEISKKNKNTKLITLTVQNVQKAEAIFDYMFPEKYIDGTNKKETVAYCFKELKKYIDNHQEDKENYEELIRKIVKAVNKENSTHINADGRGIEMISKRLLTVNAYRLKELLIPKDGKYEIIKLIATKSDTSGNGYNTGRRNLSFASKFCHYACYYLFDDENRDDYSIYDSVVRMVMPEYMYQYGVGEERIREIKNVPNNDEAIIGYYKNYQNEIENVIKASGANITRNGFDHLLWVGYSKRIKY